MPSTDREILTIGHSAHAYEAFLALFLDSQNRVIASDELFRGTLAQTSVYPREVAKAALRHNAAAVIFATSTRLQRGGWTTTLMVM